MYIAITYAQAVMHKLRTSSGKSSVDLRFPTSNIAYHPHLVPTRSETDGFRDAFTRKVSAGIRVFSGTKFQDLTILPPSRKLHEGRDFVFKTVLGILVALSPTPVFPSISAKLSL